MELLELLIDNWESKVYATKPKDPIQLLKSLMEVHQLKSVDLVKILGIQRSAVSQILSYKKGLSKDVIRKLSEHFKLSQEAFDRPYKLV
jgi:HTH-type transcriptional regulator/antitoxin HigA